MKIPQRPPVGTSYGDRPAAMWLYNNYGLFLRDTPSKAIKQFHLAIHLNPENPTTLQNGEGIIRMMGKNPASFEDRIELGDRARFEGDYIGAVIEYGAALKLKDDRQTHSKLAEIYRQLNENEKATAEDNVAARLSNTR